MLGQGRPQSASRKGLPLRHCVVALRFWVIVACGLFTTACLERAVVANPETSPNSMRVRVTWGGGPERTWHLILNIDQGNLTDPQLLGLTADTPGSGFFDGGRFELKQPSATNYGGVDIAVSGRPESRLSIEIYPAENPEQRVVRTVQLQSLKSESLFGPLDSENNQFSIGRAPGDFIQVETKRNHLIFDCGESWEFKVWPNLCPTNFRSARCTARLVAARTAGPVLQSQSWDVSLDEYGNGEPHLLRWILPNVEGVYDINLEIEPRRYQQASFGGSKINRRIQLVVLERETPGLQGEPSNPFRLVDSIDAPQTIRWDRRFGLTGRVSLPAYLRNGNAQLTRITDVGGQKMLHLEPGQWQTIPLPIKEIGIPHRLEIDYQNSHDLALGFSILEADEIGNLALFGPDSGVVRGSTQTVSASTGGSAVATHSIELWPSSSQPMLLITNRHAKAEAAFGQVRVLAGKQRLPELNSTPVPSAKSADQDLKSRTLAGSPISVESNSHRSVRAAPQTPDEIARRKRLAFYEYPLFSENFGAQWVKDPLSDQLITDWVTFYEGADRLVQYLHSRGFDGAIITVATDGSSLYPSRLLQPTPRFDSGIFASTGQDPVRKDVVELLMRMFSREGLEFVPAISLNARIPAIEDSIRRNGDSPLLLDQFGRIPSNGSELPRYNPLNNVVQQELQRIVFEIVDRFGHHSAFSGVSVNCRADTCMLLPGRRWGFDLESINRFMSHCGLQSISSTEEIGGEYVQQTLLATRRNEWVEFRCEEMAKWYQDLERTIRSGQSNARLYLAGIDLYRVGDLPSILCPSLQWSNDVNTALKELGWDLKRLRGLSHSIVLRPNRVAPSVSLPNERVEINLANQTQTRDIFSFANHSADLFVHRASWATISEPSNSTSSETDRSSAVVRWQPMSPAEEFERQRFAESLALFDTRLFVDGGWLLPRSEAANGFASVFRKLPDQPFEMVIPKTDQAQGSPVTVRQSWVGDRWFAYAVNSSPWPATIDVRLNHNPRSEISNLSPEFEFRVHDHNSVDPALSRQNSEAPFQLQVLLPPFELAAFECGDGELAVESYEVSIAEREIEQLRGKLRRLQERLVLASTSRPMPVLLNPEFNLIDEPGFGWQFDSDQAASIRLDHDPIRDDNSALHLQSKGETVWIRSNEFALPETGRLSIATWLRVDDATQQPPLRIAIEAETKQGEYYRFARVGSLARAGTNDAIDSNWRQFVVHFDDLPIGSAEVVRIGFDLMGPGDVWVDSIQINDRWFDGNDTKALTQLLATAGPLLDNPASWNECRRLLDGYWLQFLDQMFPADSAGGGADETGEPEAKRQDESDSDSSSNPFSLRRLRRTDKPRMLPFR